MKYPWDEWTDGAWHRVAETDVPKTFREMVRNHARRKGLEVGITRMRNGDYAFRLGEAIRDGKFIGVGGEEFPFVDEVPDEAEDPCW